MEAKLVELALHGGDRGFQRGVLARDEAFGLHVKVPLDWADGGHARQRAVLHGARRAA